MKKRIPQLPKWCLTNLNPAFYDTESGTAVEQTARLYGTMQDLIDDYNKFASDVNTTINTFVNDSNADQEEFESHITKIVHDYIIMMDTKLELQDKEIQDSIVFIKENLEQGITNVIKQLVESGEIDEVVANAFNNIGDRVDILETDMTNTKTRVSELESIFTTNDIVLRIDNLETKEGEIDSRVLTLEENNTNLIERVTNIESKKYYFDSVELMKQSDLKIGDIVQTIGYYSVNDGGCATYKIVSSATADGYFVHQLSNGLFAELIIENNTVNIKQIGARPQDKENNKYDIKPYLENYIAELNKRDTTIKLYIPAGIWHTSPVVLYRPTGFNIHGDKNFETWWYGGTVITSLNDNQDYVIQLGTNEVEDELHIMQNFVFDDITISSAEFEYREDRGCFVCSGNKNITNALKLLYATFGNLNNLFFSHIVGSAIKITSCWELFSNVIHFRYISSYNSGVMILGTRDTSVNGNANISNCEFGILNFEGCHGDLILSEKSSYFLHSKIGSIMFEDHTFTLTDEVYTAITDGVIPEDTEHFRIINNNGNFQCIIDSIILNNIAKNVFLHENKNYVYDIISENTGAYGSFSCIVNSISVVGMGKDVSLFTLKEGNYTYRNSYSIFKNICNDSIFDFIFDVFGARFIECDGNLKGYKDTTFPIKNLDVIPFYKTALRKTNPLQGLIYSDKDSLNDLGLVVKPYNGATGTVDSVNLLTGYLYCTGKNILIRAKVPVDVTANMVMVDEASNVTNIAIEGTGEFKNYNFAVNELTEIGSTLRYRLGGSESGKDCYLDYYKFY